MSIQEISRVAAGYDTNVPVGERKLAGTWLDEYCKANFRGAFTGSNVLFGIWHVTRHVPCNLRTGTPARYEEAYHVLSSNGDGGSGWRLAAYKNPLDDDGIGYERTTGGILVRSEVIDGLFVPDDPTRPPEFSGERLSSTAIPEYSPRMTASAPGSEYEQPALF